CFACTDAKIEYQGEEDVKRIASGSTLLSAEDVFTFSFFPEKNLNASICVITCFKGNRRAMRFIESLELDNPSEDEVRQNIIHTGLRVSLAYASPMWWDTLSPELQAYTSELQLSNIVS